MAITIILAIVWAIVCSNMAQKRHRDPSLGAIGGLIFGIFAIIYYALAGDKNALPSQTDDWAKQIKGDK